MTHNNKCTFCGGTTFVKSGKKIDRQGTWQKLLCLKCGHVQKGEKIKENK